METLDLSGTTQRSEGRLKALFWPSIQSATDADYLGTQGYWICTIVAAINFFQLVVAGHFILAAAMTLFFYVGGVGVRERSRYAAAVLFVAFLINTIASPGILSFILTGILLSNLRATWIAAAWKPESEEAVEPPRLSTTLGDKFADQFPRWLWPKMRILYYVFSIVFLVIVVAGLILVILHPLPR